MAAGLGTELYTLATSFDPYGAYRQGGMEAQKYDLEQQKLDIKQQTMKDAQADLASQAKPAGAQPMEAQAGAPLASMAKSMLPPGTQLETPDGNPTASGIFQQGLMQSQQEQAEGQRLLKKAKLYEAMDEGDLAIKAGAEGRRLLDKSLTTKTSGFEKYQKAVDDGLASAYGANSQAEYMQRVKDATERTGIPKPAWLPETWAPDVKKLILSKMSQDERQKITKQEEDANYKKLLETNLALTINKKTASGRDDGEYSKDVKKLGPAVRKIAEEFNTNPEDLIGMDSLERKQANGAYKSLNRVEDIASFIDQHPDSVGTLASVTKKFGSKTENFIDNLKKPDVQKNLTGDAAVLSKKLITQALDDVTASVGGRVNQMLERTFMQQIYDQSLSKDTLKRVLADRQREAAKALDEVGIDVNQGDKKKYKFYNSNYEESRPGGSAPSAPAKTSSGVTVSNWQ